VKDTRPPSKHPEKEYEVERFFAMVFHPCKKQITNLSKNARQMVYCLNNIVFSGRGRNMRTKYIILHVHLI